MFMCHALLISDEPILAQCSLSVPPENVRKTLVFEVSRGYRSGGLG